MPIDHGENSLILEKKINHEGKRFRDWTTDREMLHLGIIIFKEYIIFFFLLGRGLHVDRMRMTLNS